MVLYCNDFKESLFWKNPRVSLETLFDAILQSQLGSIEKLFKEYSKLKDLQEFVVTIKEFDMNI